MHAEEAHRLFVKTANPALIARSTRLFEAPFTPVQLGTTRDQQTVTWDSPFERPRFDDGASVPWGLAPRPLAKAAPNALRQMLSRRTCSRPV